MPQQTSVCSSSTPRSTTTSVRASCGGAGAAGGGGANPSSAPLYADAGGGGECRLNMPPGSPGVSDAMFDESGALKYRKRRRDVVSLVRSSRFVVGLLALAGLAFIAYTLTNA